MATLANNISKLEAIVAKFLATSVSNTNKTDMTKTATQVITNFTNINTDVTNHQNTSTPITTNNAKPEKTTAQVLIVPSSSITNIENVPVQNTTTINVSTTIIKTDIEVATSTPPPPPLPPIVQHDTATLHQTCDFSTLIEDKLVIASASSMTKIQNEVAIQSRVSLPLLIEDMLAILRCGKTFHPGHQFHPPKLFFLNPNTSHLGSHVTRGTKR